MGQLKHEPHRVRVCRAAQHNLRKVAVGERSGEEVENCAGFGNFRSNAAFGPEVVKYESIPFGPIFMPG